MKKLSLLVCLLGFVIKANSQLTIQLMSTDPYYVHAKDVMKVIITNGYDDYNNAKLVATLTYFDQKVLTIESQSFALTKGTNIFDLSAQINQMQWVMEDLKEADETTNGLLPGKYKVCYNLFEAAKQQSLLDGQLCENYTIEFPTPLLLAYPFDKAELEEKNPILSWIAPLPAGLDKNINYKMSLYENRENKPKSMVLNQRPSAVIESPLTNTNLPSTIPELEPGVSYYWKVDAYIGRNFLVSSEVWEFKLKEPKKVIVPKVYVKLNEAKDDIHPARLVLRVMYVSEKIPGLMTYKISNPTNGMLLREGTLSFSLGENSWEIPITGLNLENENFLNIEFSSGTESYKMKFLPLD